MCPPPVMTPDAPDRSYSTRLRTAVVLTGSGTAAAYHAGVLRALHEAGLKIDLVAGRGAGAIGAFFAAVDGGAKLWDADGIWRSRPAARFYGWRPALRVAGWALVAAARHLRRAACAAGAGGGGRDDRTPSYAGRARRARARCCDRVSAPGSTRCSRQPRFRRSFPDSCSSPCSSASRRWRPASSAGSLRARAKRRTAARHDVASSRLAAERSDGGRAEPGGAVESDSRRRADRRAACVRARAQVRRTAVGQSGAAGIPRAARDGPRHGRASRPRVRDARQPRIGSVSSARPPAAEASGRALETFDLAGVGRDHALDALAGALAIPVATEPHLADVLARRCRGAAKRIACAIDRARSPGCSKKWRSPGRSR